MKKFDALVFDLDGTLWNACTACAEGWSMGLQTLGSNKIIEAADIESVCGLTYPDCVRTLCPEFSEAELPMVMQALDRHERLAVESAGGVLYPVVLEGLSKLAQKYRLFLVSNCQEWYLETFLMQVDGHKIFEDWECYGRTQMPKLDNLKALASRRDLQSPLYIGDTEGDKIAALGAGYDFAFVRYGFGHTQADQSYSSFLELIGALY